MKITVEEMDVKVRACLERVGFQFDTAEEFKAFIALSNKVEMREHDGYYETIHNDIILFKFKPLEQNKEKMFELKSEVEYFDYV